MADFARRVGQLLRVGSPRFTALYCTGFLAGTTLADGISVRLLAAWLGYWLLFCVAVEWLNRLVDLPADRVNQPQRTRMALSFGVRTLRPLIVAIWLAVAVWSMALVCTLHSPPRQVTAAVVLSINIAIGIGYSIGRFAKRRPKLALLLLSATTVLPMVTGVVAGADIPTGRELVVLVAGALLLGTSSLAIAGAKDLTDIVGDRLIGYQSPWVKIIGSGPGRNAVALLAVQIIAAIVIAVAGNSAFAVVALAVVPLELAVVVLATRGRSMADFVAIREFMYLVTMSNVALTGIAVVGEVDYLAMVAACLLAWTVLSRYAHWHRQFSWTVLQHISTLARRVPTSVLATSTARL
ncbi:UbiA family prenyltransferase [Nocardia sp. NBC_01499]|uniref:UbiA family prenyltransferase n=1 Tax=Nocardia sp. NBC_01499 TaxID=2903597 RepID=UPI003869A9D5